MVFTFDSSLFNVFFTLSSNSIITNNSVEGGGKAMKVLPSIILNDLKYYILIIYLSFLFFLFKLKGYMKNKSRYYLTVLSFFSSSLFCFFHLIGAAILVKDDALFFKYTGHSDEEMNVKSRIMLCMYITVKFVENINCIILVLEKKEYYSTMYNLGVSTLFSFSSVFLSAHFCYSILFLSFLFNFCSYALHSLSFLLYLNNKIFVEIKRMVMVVKVVYAITCFCLSIQSMYDIKHNQNLLWWNSQFVSLLYIYFVFVYVRSYMRYFHVRMRAGMATFLFLFHVFGVVGFIKMYSHPASIKIFIQAILLYMLSGLGITVGAHRLWAHRSYSANKSFRIFIMILNSLANQGTIFHWSRDHRVHHKYSELPADPHNAARGFFYAHVGWLLLKKNEEVTIAGREIDCSDLLLDDVVMFQKRYDPYWNQFCCFVIPSLFGYYYYGDFWLGFFVFGAFRWIITLHATWTVNSVAHLWGERPYNPNINPSENLFTSLVAVGEGWHNWHHVYPFDYAASEGGILTNYNPSKCLIDIAAYFGFVWDRKRATKFWEATKLRRLREIEKNAAKKIKHDDNLNSQKLNLISSLPPHCTKKSLIRSTLNLCRDLLICFSIAMIAIYIKNSAVGKFCSERFLINQIVNFILWTIYALAQGTVAFGVWVLGYEASGGRFSDYRLINHMIGMILHSAIMIPYRPRRANRERQRASLMRCLREDAFAILKIPMWKAWMSGALSAITVLVINIIVGYNYGLNQIAKWYFGPWVVLNIWLMLYHWLLHNGPQDSVELDIDSSSMEYFTREWLESILPKATRGRTYPWNKFFDHLHHHLSLSHIIQAVDFNVPHYHALEAFRRLGDLLHEFGEIVDAKTKFCQQVENVCSNNKIMKHSNKHSTIASVTTSNNAQID